MCPPAIQTNRRRLEPQVECCEPLRLCNHADLDDSMALENEVDDYARLTSWREHEAGIAVHQCELRGPCAALEYLRNAVATADFAGDPRHIRTHTCFHGRCVCTQDNVGIKDREEGGKVVALRCSEKCANDFTLARPVGFRRSRCALDTPTPSACELSRRHRRATDDRRNLIERDIEQVMQHECDPLRRREGFEHHQHRIAKRVREQLLALRIVGPGHGFHRGIDRDFASRLACAKHVETDAGNDRREPAGEVVDAAGTGAHESEKGLLDRILGLGRRAEYPAGNRPEVAPMGFEALRRSFCRCHSHIPMAPSVMSMTGDVRAM
jgi:hypothetical protein